MLPCQGRCRQFDPGRPLKDYDFILATHLISKIELKNTATSHLQIEAFLNRIDAIKREREIKKYKGGIKFRKLGSR